MANRKVWVLVTHRNNIRVNVHTFNAEVSFVKEVLEERRDQLNKILNKKEFRVERLYYKIGVVE